MIFSFPIYNRAMEAITWTCLFAFSDLSFSFLPKELSFEGSIDHNQPPIALAGPD